MASSRSLAPVSGAPKRDPTHMAQGEDKRQKSQPMSMKGCAEVCESRGEVKKVMFQRWVRRSARCG